MLDLVLCSCGSGLRQIRCCNFEIGAAPEPASLEILNAMVVEATKLFNEKKTSDAETLVLKLLDLAPNRRLATRILLELRKAEGRNPATEVLARRLAALPARDAAQTSTANLVLAQWLISQGRHAEAEPAARLALKNSPRDLAAHQVMGIIFTETGQWRQGEHHYRRALALQDPGDGMVLGNLAWNLKLQGRLEEAAGYYERALAAGTANRRVIGGYAQVEAARGNMAHAAALLDTALAEPDADRSLRLLRALLDLLLNQPEAVLGRLDDAAAALLPPELIARGQAYLRLGQTRDAIAAFGSAKVLQRDRFGRRYKAAAYIKEAEQTKTFFTAGRFADLPRSMPEKSPQPVFLLGFPGSGTSLLEQMLAKIPGFAAADECNPIASLLNQPELANYPDCLADYLVGDGPARLARLRTQYLLELNGIATEKHRFFTLRAAGDFWHLGLIKMLFPEAPIIHLLRHPLDIAVTNFARDKKLEGDCAIALASLAQHYALTMSVIRNYRGQLTLRYLPVRYEALVDDPAGSLREILQFIGSQAAIPSDAELRANPPAAAHRIPGHAVPPGHVAVPAHFAVPSHVISQKPIHAHGVERFRKFEAVAPNLFAEIRPLLAPWIEALGYTA
jgi:Flp pilus assembly protein TadD